MKDLIYQEYSSFTPYDSLRPIDIEFMRRLHQKVNLIPVIAKSDTMTDEEITLFKARVLSDIAHHQIEIFHAPVYDNEDEETMTENDEIVVSPQRSEKNNKRSATDTSISAAQDSLCRGRIRHRD